MTAHGSSGAGPDVRRLLRQPTDDGAAPVLSTSTTATPSPTSPAGMRAAGLDATAIGGSAAPWPWQPDVRLADLGLNDGRPIGGPDPAPHDRPTSTTVATGPRPAATPHHRGRGDRRPRSGGAPRLLAADGPGLDVGRSSRRGLVVPDGEVSRHHLTIVSRDRPRRWRGRRVGDRPRLPQRHRGRGRSRSTGTGTVADHDAIELGAYGARGPAPVRRPPDILDPLVDGSGWRVNRPPSTDAPARLDRAPRTGAAGRHRPAGGCRCWPS